MEKFQVVDIKGEIVVQNNNLRLHPKDSFSSEQTLLFGSSNDRIFALCNGEGFMIIPRPNLRSYEKKPLIGSMGGRKKVIDSIEALANSPKRRPYLIYW